MTWLDLVRAFFPDASEDEAGYILWERTPFPLVSPGETARHVARFRAALARLNGRGDLMCEFCNNRVRPGKSTCWRCWRAFLPRVTTYEPPLLLCERCGERSRGL